MSKKNSNHGSHEENDGELSILLVVTVIIGMLLMASLLLCYICVFRQLCCETVEESKRRRHRDSQAARGDSRDGMPLADITHVSSQPTETERI